MTKSQASRFQSTREMNRRAMLANTALSAFGLTGLNTENNGVQTNSNVIGGNEIGNFPPHPKWNFVFINHATTITFFIPTRYGIEDACNMLGCSYEWTGSASNKVSDMVEAMENAIVNKADGIAVSLVDPFAFNAPVDEAINAGIPVIAYNADVPSNSPNRRMAYIGQGNYESGVQVGERIIQLIPEGDVVGFSATPGLLNIQPRIDGIIDTITRSGKPIHFIEYVTGDQTDQELTNIEEYYLSHQHIRGMFGVDSGSTQGIAQVMAKYGLASKGIHSGGYDLLPITLLEIDKGNLDFSVDQQPYLQGFLPVVQLFLYKLSGGLIQPSNTNTGLVFITKENVKPYLSTQTRFEGSSSKEMVLGH